MAEKVFKTYKEQRKLLEERGLIINHPRSFQKSLQQDDYYNIINGYKKYFIATMHPEQYIAGTTFEQLHALYSFDQKIRAEFFSEFIKIEKHIKSLIAYHFSEVHGYDHRLYLDIDCFKHASRDNRQYAQRMIAKIEREISHYQRQGTSAICHYLHEYGYVPLWVLNSILSFGQVAHFYSCMNLDEQKSVAEHFKLSPGQLDGFIYFLSDMRNTCAHGSRIYTSNKIGRFQKIIPDTLVHRHLGISRTDAGNYLIGKTDVLAILITLKYFSAKSDFGIVKKHFKKYYTKMASQIPEPILQNIHNEMGCPMNYLNRL